MHARLLKPVLAFLFPGGLLFMMALGFLRPNGLPTWCQEPVAALPYVALAFGLVFGWHFSSTRMLFALVSLAFADQALLAFPLQQDADSVNQIVFTAAAFLLPINFLAFSIVREECPGTIRGITRIVLLLIQPLFVAWLCDPSREDLAAAIRTAQLAGWSTQWTPLPQTALLAFLISGVMHAVRFAAGRDPMDAGGAWALAAVFVAFHSSQFGWNATPFFSTAALILFISLLQTSYRRTYRDELTGVSGRHAYEEATAQLGSNFALAVVGIDQLKSYAGSHGKPVMEQILKLLAPKMQTACQGRYVFRVSGEEFTVLFPHQSAMEALVVLDHVRSSIESTALFLRGREHVWEHRRGVKTPGGKDRALPVTVSIGVAEKSSDDKASLNQVIKGAYRALYEVKGAGGNAVKRGGVSPESGRRSHGHGGRIVPASEY
jgi:diguanylate cyclase (GGDEF)-like protein